MFQFTEFNQPIVFEVNIDQKVNIGQRSTSKVVFLKSSIFIQSTWNLKRIYISSHWFQPPIIFEANIGQRVKIRPIYKIVHFHLIDLKFEEEWHIWSLNSSTNYIWGQISLMDFASIVLCMTSSSCYLQNRRFFKYICQSILIFCLSVCWVAEIGDPYCQ